MNTESNINSNSEHINMDDIAKSFQREADALREIVRARDMQITALKAHSLSLQVNFKDVLGMIVDKFADADVQFHARKMIELIDRGSVTRVES